MVGLDKKTKSCRHRDKKHEITCSSCCKFLSEGIPGAHPSASLLDGSKRWEVTAGPHPPKLEADNCDMGRHGQISGVALGAWKMTSAHLRFFPFHPKPCAAICLTDGS
jgi:hypothetical protein